MSNATEQWNVDATGLKVGGKLWSARLGWVVITRMNNNTVWVRPDSSN